jgi:hypothetical protein
MSAFTRLYYANRGLGGFGGEDSDDYSFEGAFHDPPVPIVPEAPFEEPAPTLYGGVRLSSEMRHPRHAGRNPS